MVAHFFPALGDPLNLSVARFNGLLERLVDVLEVVRNEPSTDAQRNMHRLLEAGDPDTLALYGV